MLKGTLFSLLASVLFSYMYYFSTLLGSLGGEGIFGYRMILTFPFVLGVIITFRQTYALKMLFRRIVLQPSLLLAISLCSAIIGSQMWLFLWAPNNGSSLSLSLGYLLLPICLVVIARIVFKEYISPLKFVAVISALIGVVINISLKGGLSWEASFVCVGYSLYFVIRKKLQLMNLASFCLEVLFMLPVCIYFVGQINLAEISQSTPSIYGLLVGLGFISGTALTFYIAASNILPMNVLGLLGYVEPVMMVIISFLLGEVVDTRTYPLFLCLLLAMGLILIDGILTLRRQGVKPHV